MPVDADVSLIVEAAPNRDNLHDLIDALSRGAGLIPFVGAGLSRPFGFPEWGAFLLASADNAGIADAVRARLARAEYEEAAEDLQTALGSLAFEDAIRRTFDAGRAAPSLPEAAVHALPALATGPVLTTNFDRVLETAFEEAGAGFENVVSGTQPGRVAQALHVNARLLWKIHGDVRSLGDRVLTNTEYAEHYGHTDPAQVNWQLPLPRLFENLLAARPVLFLGCSLEQDRIVRILRAFALRHPGVGHYALLEDPGEDARRHTRARDLSNVGVRPLWFPRTRFDLIGPFLRYLAGQCGSAGSRTDIDSQRERIERGIEAHRGALAEADADAPAFSEPMRVVGDRPDRAERFQGRDEHLRQLGAELSASSGLLTLVGPSGIGKTALAVRLLAGLERNLWPAPANGRVVDGIAYLSTRTEGISLERVYFACARLLGGERRTSLERDWKKEQLGVLEKIDRLLDALVDGFYVILLDHIEDLLDDDGRITDDGVRTLVERSLTRKGAPRLIVTSRVRLSLSREAAKQDRSIVLNEGLGEADGIAMLRDLDRNAGFKRLPDQTLGRVVTRLHGVPRALEVFAGILEDDPTETVDHLLEHFYDRADVVADLFREGIDRLDDQSQRVVEALAVLGQPAPSAAIDLLLQPFVPGLDLPEILRRLHRRQLVRVFDRVVGTWALHPIDRDFAYARCPEIGRYSRQALHHRAAEWYASIRTPRDKWRTIEGLDPLLREFDHRVKAGLFDDAAAVLAEFDDEFRGRLGYAAQSLAMHQQIEGRITVDRLRMLHTLGLAHAYRHIGPVEQAIVCYRDTIAMARAQEDPAVEIEALGWMGETFRRLGRLDEGVQVVREAVNAARQSGDRACVARWLCELAITSCYRGELTAALRAAEEAHAAALESANLNWEALALDALALVHHTRGEPAKVIQAADQAVERYKEGSWEHTVIYVVNVMGLAYLDLGRVDDAIDALNRAWEESRVYEDVRVEGMTRFNLAHAYRLKPDIDTAIEMADDALRCFQRTGGGERPAAEALVHALKARAAGIRATEARALVAVARASLSNPDLRHPRGILEEARQLARDAGLADVEAEAEQLLAAVRATDERIAQGADR